MFRALATAAATLVLIGGATALTASAAPGEAADGTASAPAAAADADADLELVACVLGAEHATYSPALDTTPSPTTISVQRTYDGCVSVLEPGITSGSTSIAISRPAHSCLTLTGGGAVTSTVTWNDGRTSTLSGTSTATIAGALLVSTETGTITSGLFAGSSYVHVVASPALSVTTCTLGLGSVPALDGTTNLVVTA